jgi:hypothetical protein
MQRMDQNLSTVPVESTSRNNGCIAPSTSDLCKKEICSSTNSEESIAGSDSLDGSLIGTDSKSLKVQMKVGSNNFLPRKNAAVNSGLGLDISSSASMEQSHDGLGGQSPEFGNVPYESPQTILQVAYCIITKLIFIYLTKQQSYSNCLLFFCIIFQIMACFEVPGGFMLSPLHDNILQLSNKVAPLPKKWEAYLGMENVPSNEDETPNGLNALYVIRAPAISVSSGGPRPADEDTATLNAQNINGQLGQSRKRKTALRDGNGLIGSSYHTPVETSPMSNQRNRNKQKRTIVDENGNFGRDSLRKHDLMPMSKSAEVYELDNGQQAGNVESQAAEKPIFHGSLQGSSDSNNKEVAKLAQVQLLDGTRLEGFSGNNQSKASWRRGFHKNGTIGKTHLPSNDKKGLDMERPSQNTGLNVTIYQNKTSVHHQGCGSSQKLGISFCEEEKSKSRTLNQDIQKPPTQDVHVSIKQGKQKVCSTSVKIDTCQMEALSRRSNVKNGVQHATSMQAGSKPSGDSAIGKDGSMVAFALKEARDLKHKANHLKVPDPFYEML